MTTGALERVGKKIRRVGEKNDVKKIVIKGDFYELI